MMSDSHSLLHVGAQCAHPSCNQVDFLPIKCRCQKNYCSAHSQPDSHDCPVTSLDKTTDQLQKTSSPIRRCALSTCSNVALDAFNESAALTCPKCYVSFCAQHRYPDSHGCMPPEKQEPEKNNEARKLLEKHFPKKESSSRSSRKIRKPLTPQQRKIELIRMRHHAKAGDPRDKSASLPVDQRVHVKIKSHDVEKILWFRKNLSTGKVLDCIAPDFGMTTDKPIRLFHLEGIPLQNDSVFAEEIMDGDTLLLEYVSQT